MDGGSGKDSAFTFNTRAGDKSDTGSVIQNTEIASVSSD